MAITVDLRNSSFAGTPQENAGAIEVAVGAAIERHLGRGAYVAGYR